MIINHLPEIMAAKGISIRHLSQLTDVTYTTIWAIYHSERRSVQLEVLGAICRTLEVQPGDIYTSVNEKVVKSSFLQQDILPAEVISPVKPNKKPELATVPPSNDWKNW